MRCSCTDSSNCSKFHNFAKRYNGQEQTSDKDAWSHSNRYSTDDTDGAA